MAHLVEHLERNLGTVAEGWSKNADGNSQHAQVLKFEEGPLDGVVAYSTLGLSRLHWLCRARRRFGWNS